MLLTTVKLLMLGRSANQRDHICVWGSML